MHHRCWPSRNCSSGLLDGPAPGSSCATVVLLVQQGCVDTIATLEYMAQTIAACLGYEAFQAGAGVRVGMIVACRRMTIDRPIVAVGEQLDIGVERVRARTYVSHSTPKCATPTASWSAAPA